MWSALRIAATRFVSRPLGSAGLALALLLAGGVPAEAMRVSPVILDLSATGRGTTGSIRVENPATAPIAVQLSLTRRPADGAAGGPAAEPADDAFLVFPP